MKDLFEASAARGPDRPLADRMRPSHLDQMVGHEAVIGNGGFLRQAIERDALPCLILWGPPGSGKTTLARVLAHSSSLAFEPFSAVLSGVKQVREIVARATNRRAMTGSGTLFFVDEIHRFNKGQQDAFLPHVEDGTLVLVGATTENPSFALNAALLSRCRVVSLEPLAPTAIRVLLERAVADVESGLGARGVTVDGEVYDAIAKAADGDARCALNMLEQAVGQVDGPDQPVTMACVREWLSSAPLRHDRDGDAHYDIVSAFIKSMRGSDPDASLYYLARLLEAGDEPRFIFRRMLVFAAEDVGNADPRALGIATDGARAFEQVGMPEGRIILGQVCTYLACAPKSNAAYKAMDAAIAAVRETGSLPVPMKLRNAASALMRELGHGKGYVYPHDHGGYVPEEYAPEALRGRVFYEPGDAGYERHIQERLLQWRRLRGDSGGDE